MITSFFLLLFQGAEQPPVVETKPVEGGNGGLWRVYQEEVLRLLAKPKSKRAERRRKAKEATRPAADALVEELPSERPLEALQSELAAERGRIDALSDAIGQIEARRAAEADEAERKRIRRKRNNEAALLLLAA